MLTFWPRPNPLGPHKEIDPWPSKILFDLFHAYSSSVCVQNFCLKLTTGLLMGNKIVDLRPLPKRSGVWSIFYSSVLIFRHWAIMVHSESLFNIIVSRKC